MRSALGSVSGGKASLTTVHAKLEAIVLRARRHQGVGNSIADARARAEYLRNAATVVVLGQRVPWWGADRKGYTTTTTTTTSRQRAGPDRVGYGVVEDERNSGRSARGL
jgi:hypothetical protein